MPVKDEYILSRGFGANVRFVTTNLLKKGTNFLQFSSGLTYSTIYGKMECLISFIRTYQQTTETSA